MAKKSEVETPKTKLVRNRGGHRVELFINGQVVVFLPGASVKVPTDAVIPQGVGLIER